MQKSGVYLIVQKSKAIALSASHRYVDTSVTMNLSVIASTIIRWVLIVSLGPTGNGADRVSRAFSNEWCMSYINC